MHRKKETWDTSLNENRSLNTNSFVVLVSNTWGNPMLMPCAVCKKTIITPCTNISSKISLWNEMFGIRYFMKYHLPNSHPNKYWHSRYTKTTPRDQNNFNKFSLSFEVLPYHQGGRVSCHGNTNTYKIIIWLFIGSSISLSGYIYIYIHGFVI